MNNLSNFKPCGYLKTTVTGKLLYLVLSELSDSDGAVVIPQRKICSTLNLSRSAVSRNLRRLEHIGAIRIMPTFHYDGGRAANKYIVW